MRTAICERCKAQFETDRKNVKYCDECREAAYREKSRVYEHECREREKASKRAENRKSRKSTKTIQDIAKEARAHGMSYGQWVAIGGAR